MSGVSLPVTRPSGRAIVVATAACQAQPLGVLERLGFDAAPVADPYAAMVEVCRRPLVFRALVLSLQSLYREELQIISSIKRRYPHVEIWLTQTDGRHAALAEAMRLGADGLLDEDGLHRTAAPMTVPEPTIIARSPSAELAPPPAARTAASEHEPAPIMDETATGEPVLTADELRALLQEQPSMPPSGSDN